MSSRSSSLAPPTQALPHDALVLDIPASPQTSTSPNAHISPSQASITSSRRRSSNKSHTSHISISSSQKAHRHARKPIHLKSIKRKVLYSTTAAGRRSAKAAGSVLADFKSFIDNGHVVDLAIGLVVGGAFTAVITSFVSDIVGPIIGLAIGSQMQNAFVILRGPDPEVCRQNSTACATKFKTPSQAYAAGCVTWNYGMFFQSIINFIITASVIFFAIKIYGTAFRRGKSDERDCQFCLKKVPRLALKCYQCGSVLPPLPSKGRRGMEGDGVRRNSHEMAVNMPSVDVVPPKVDHG